MFSRTLAEKRNGILGDDADLPAQRAAGDVADVDAVDEDAALGRVVEARHERGERRLAGAGVADQRHRPARREHEVDLLEHGPVGRVAEGDAVEADLARAGRQLARAGAVVDALGLVHDLEDPLAGRGRSLALADPHSEAAERDDQHREQEVEDEELGQAERAVHDHPAGGEEDGALREQRQEGEQRDVERALPEGADGLLEDGAGGALELRLAAILLRERLDDVDADDRLLRHRRDVAELLLHLAQNRVRDVAVAVGDGDDQRRDRERDQRQLPLDDEEHDHHRDDRERVLEEEDQAEAEEEAHRLQVDGRARHQLARLVAVVEAEREPQQVRVERLAHVLLDPERLPAGDDPAAEHQRRLDDADDRDRDDEPGEHRRAPAGLDPVDRLADEQDDRDRGRLREDGEDRRDEQRPAVRPQEAEQAHERAAIRDGSRHSDES